MTKISKLKAGRVESAPPWIEQRGVLASVLQISRGSQTANDPARVLTHVQLESSGLKIFRGNVVVGIEIDELIRLAVECDPALAGEDLPGKG
jgi:hypothetical protein